MSEKDDAMIAYNKSVEWLRGHVPPDDIYDFAEQMIISAECILLTLAKHVDIPDLMKKDEVFSHWTENVMSVHFMRESGYNGIIDTSISVRSEEKE